MDSWVNTDGYEYTWDKNAKDQGWEPVDIISKEVEPGYKIGDKVIRTAKVIVKPGYRRKSE